MNLFRRIQRARFNFFGLFYLSVSLICTQLPLLNYLGYEFSTVIALVGTFIAGFATIKSIRGSLQNPQSQIPDHALSAFKQSLILNFTLLIIPLIVMLTNAFFVKNCSLLEGIGFFLLVPVVSVVFSSSLGFFCAIHYRLAKTVFVVIVLATFAEVLAVGYFTPAIFSYNFFFGYFPGLTYDEALGIGLPLVVFRLLTLVLAAALVWMTWLLLTNTKREDKTWEKGVALLGVMVQGKNTFITAALATLVIVTWWFRGELGFDSTSMFIQRQLGQRHETEHFIIYYSSQSYSANEMHWIAAEHEFRLKQITNILSLNYRSKIESYIYPSSEAKKRLMGAGNTNIAKPWSGQIHLTKQSLDGTLKHELVHVVAAPFGVPIVNASLSTGLVEGLAMAIEWDWGNRTLHQYAAAMKKFGVGPDISSLMTITGFASQSSSISYVLAGSFCRFLIETYGIRNMMLVYRSSDYDAVYGKPLKAIITEWRAFLVTVPVAEQERDAIDVLFRRPPIFEKVCARVVAARNILAGKKFAHHEYEAAAGLYRQSYEDGRGYDALSGFLTSTLRAGQFADVISTFDTATRGSQNPSQYIPLMINVGLAQWGNGHLDAARALFQRVEIADLGETLTESSVICRVATRDSTNRDALLRYFLSSPSDSQRVVLLDSMAQNAVDHWLPIYLKGRVLMRLERWEQALLSLQRLEQGLPEPILEAQRLKTVGFVLFRLKRFEDAKRMYWQSLNFVNSEVAQNEVNDWVERCDWIKRY
ncbi:MAG: hypothetical protein HY961_13520 [Ignavibacteriae bacterium]|nr:hypothetical protein [Ignavibacteriota bacterium]